MRNARALARCTTYTRIGSSLPFTVAGVELLDVEHAADVAVGVVRDEHAAERRGVLAPGWPR